MENILVSILFGLVEGITEWLPISSTGHMILLNEFIHFDVSSEFYRMYEVVIQLGAILAVVLLFWKKFFPFGKTDRPLGEGLLKYVDRDIFHLLCKVFISMLPAAVVGLLFDDLFEALFYNYFCVALALIIFGILFIVIEKKDRKFKVHSLYDIDYKTAFLIGLWQVIAAVFPGTSRSGATIVGALLLGVARPAAAEFTFILGVPVMLGASLLRILKFGFVFTMQEVIILLVGMVTAFIVSVLVIRFLMEYIRKHSFTVFGYYRILVGLLVLIYFMVR